MLQQRAYKGSFADFNQSSQLSKFLRLAKFHCDNRFSRIKLDFAGNAQNGENTHTYTNFYFSFSYILQGIPLTRGWQMLIEAGQIWLFIYLFFTDFI